METLVWEIVVPGWVPDHRLGLNGRKRTHWRVVDRCRDAAKETFIPFIWQSPNHRQSRSQQRLETVKRARVTVEFTFPTSRRRDPDNLAGRAKPILDSLVSEGVIQDDSSACIELTIRAVVEKGVTQTRVLVEEIR